jgi:guanine nucleotide-binding protein subunit alpha
VYFNIIRSLKHILKTLATYEDVDDDTEASSTVEFGENADDDESILAGRPSGKRSRSGKATAFTNIPSASSSDHNSSSSRSPSQVPLPKSPKLQPSTYQIANLRLRLSALLSVEESLAKRLNGGVTTDTGEVFVRNGWQVRTIENGGLAKARRPKRSIGHGHGPPSNSGSGLIRTSSSVVMEEDPLLEDASFLFCGLKEDIKDLWEHPTVVALIVKRKLRLDEWSE